MIDRKIYVECTGKGAHQVRELAVLIPVGGRPDLDYGLAKEGLPPRDITEVERRGFGVEGTVTRITPGRPPKVRRKGSADLTQGHAGLWWLWGLSCPDCGLVAPLNVQHLALMANTFPPDQRVRLSQSSWNLRWRSPA